MLTDAIVSLVKAYPSITILVATGIITATLLMINEIITRKSAAPVISVTDIAGDDVVSSQLDLAQAYIEMGNISLAKPLLETVMSKGNQLQQITARKLLKTCV